MSNLDIIFGYTKKIENFLEKEFKAEGRGLHTKVSSVEYRLPIALIKKIRWIATIRNNSAHTEGFELNNIEDFKITCESVLAELGALNKEGLRLVAQDSKPLKYNTDRESNKIHSQSILSANRRNINQRKGYSFNASKSSINKERWLLFSVPLFLVLGLVGILIWKVYSPVWKVFINRSKDDNASSISEHTSFAHRTSKALQKTDH